MKSPVLASLNVSTSGGMCILLSNRSLELSHPETIETVGLLRWMRDEVPAAWDGAGAHPQL